MLLLGGHVPAIDPGSRFYLFADLMRQRGQWSSPADPKDGLCRITPDGDPAASDFSVYIVEGNDYNPSVVPDGDYTLSFQGTATVSNSNCDFATKDVTKKDGLTIMTLRVAKKNGNLIIRFANAVRNDGTPGIQGPVLLAPGNSSGDPYNKDAVRLLSGWETIRWMDATRTNGHPVWKWKDRTQPDELQSTARGLAWEHVFRFCNRARVNCYINVPHMADWEYYVELAKLARKELSPDLRLYLEYSNEVWNSMFPQFGYNVEQARVEAEDDKINYTYPGDPINAGNSMYRAFRRIPRKLDEIRNAFATVFPPAEMMTRVRPVLAYQVGWSDQLSDMLAYTKYQIGTPSERFWGVAVGWYLGMFGDESNKDNLSVDDIFASHRRQKAVMATGLLSSRKTCDAYGLRLGAYEIGTQDLDQSSFQKKVDAQDDPRMATLILDFLHESESALEFGNWYTTTGTWGPSGCWAATNRFAETSTKLDGLRTFRATNTPEPSFEPEPPVSPVIVPPPPASDPIIARYRLDVHASGEMEKTRL